MYRRKLILCLTMNLLLAWARAAQALEVTNSYLFGLETIPVVAGTEASLFLTYRNGAERVSAVRVRLVGSSLGEVDRSWVNLGSFDRDEMKLQETPFSIVAFGHRTVSYDHLNLEMEVDGETRFLTTTILNSGHTSEIYTDLSPHLFYNPIRVGGKILLEVQKVSFQRELVLFDDETWELENLPIRMQGTDAQTYFDGENIVYQNEEDEGRRRSIRLFRLSSQESRLIDPDAKHPHLAGGKVLFFKEGTLFLHDIAANQTRRLSVAPDYEIADASARLFNGRVYYVARHPALERVIVEHNIATGAERVVLHPYAGNCDIVTVNASRLVYRAGYDLQEFNFSSQVDRRFRMNSFESVRQLEAQTSAEYSVWPEGASLVLFDFSTGLRQFIARVDHDAVAMNGNSLLWLERGPWGRDYQLFPIREVILNHP